MLMMMQNRRWHTLTPAAEAPKKTTTPLVDAIRLTSLMKQAHYLANEMTDITDLETIARYNAQFPGQLTEDMKRQPHRYIYQMMAELAVEDDREGASQLARKLEKEIAQKNQDRIVLIDDDEQLKGPHGAEAARDHLGPDNIIRHMHRTPSAYNRGPPTGNDPYLGTGLNPAHVSGVIWPRDPRSVHEPKEWACCGQRIDDPGCWIQLDAKQPIGQLVRYQLWFTALPPTDFWPLMLQNNAAKRLKDFTVVGTAFIKEMYYQDLDNQIRKHLDAVLPEVIRVSNDLIKSQFAKPSGFERLLIQAQEQLKEIVGLVNRYNAPQLGACHHNSSITGAYINHHVFAMDVGREMEREGKLKPFIIVNGVEIPRAHDDNNNLKAVADALKTAGEIDASKALLKADTLFTDEANEQITLEKNRDNYERLAKDVRSAFFIAVPSYVEARLLITSSLYEEAQKLILQLEKLRAGFSSIVNGILSSGNVNDKVQKLTAKNKELQSLIASMQTQRGEADANAISKENLEKVSKALRTNPSESQMQAVFDVNTIVKDYEQLSSVQTWARWSIIQEPLQQVFPEQAKNIEATTAELKRMAFDEVGRRKQKAYEDAEDAAAKAAAAASAAKAAAIPKTSPPPTSDSSVRMEIVPVNKPPIDPSKWSIRAGFKYFRSSCTNDALFSALFLIPNQWFRNAIIKANHILYQKKCSKSTAIMVHRSMLKTIEYMEREITDDDKELSKFEDICPQREFWNACLSVETSNDLFGHPTTLFLALTEFYDIAKEKAIFRTPYGVWNPKYEELQKSTEMYCISVEEPPKGSERSMKGEYDIQQTRGEFTMISCIIGMKDHWQACVRHPVTGIWHRMLDRGYAEPLLPNPLEIKAVTMTDPARQKTDVLDMRYEGDQGAKYEPYAWFYVRTAMLSQFQNRIEIGANSQNWETLWNHTRARRSLIPLFGSEQKGDIIGPPTSGNSFLISQIGVMQLFDLVNFLNPDTSKIAIPGWQSYKPSLDKFIERVNTFLIPNYLKPLIENGYIGKDYVLQRKFLNRLRENATKAKMAYQNSSTNKVTVPLWGTYEENTKGYQKVIIIGNDEKEKEVHVTKIGKTWFKVLDILLRNLFTQNMAPPTLDASDVTGIELGKY